MKNRIYSHLTFACSNGDAREVKDLLANSKEVIDITHNDGSYFNLAAVRNAPELLKVLIDYYKKTRMQGDPDSPEYKEAEEKLIEVLDDARNKSGVGPEIRAIIKKYVPEDEDTDREADLAAFEDLMESPPLEEEEVTNPSDPAQYLKLTEEALTEHNQVLSMRTDDRSTAKEMPHTTSDSGAEHPMMPDTASVSSYPSTVIISQHEAASESDEDVQTLG